MNSQGVILICVLSLVWVGLVLATNDLNAWSEFKDKYEKNYTSQEEEEYRMKVFLENKRNIDNYNTRSAGSFVQGINSLSDLTTDEINRSRNGFRLNNNIENRQFDGLLETLLVAFNETSGNHQLDSSQDTKAWYDRFVGPAELDYRSTNRVSKVKNQGSCGSCWAFSVTGALEAALAARNKSILLSEQNLLDCSRGYGNEGCNGGLMDKALDYVRDNGIMASHDYPYTGNDKETCMFKKNKSVMQIRGSFILPRGNEPLLRLALAMTGPLPVAVDASRATFHSYKSGIYNDKTCKNGPNSLNHAILLVGYGTDPTFGDYWIVKNSWGKSWGDEGYMKLARNQRNLCGIASYAVLPIP